MITLPKRFTLIVPDTCKIDLQDIGPDLVTTAGGFTSYKVAGDWQGDDGETVHDTSTVVEVYADADNARVVLASLIAWARIMLDGGEQSAALTIDGAMVLLTLADFCGDPRRLTMEAAAELNRLAGTFGPVGQAFRPPTAEKLGL